MRTRCGEAAVHVIRLCAFLSPDAIPEGVFAAYDLHNPGLEANSFFSEVYAAVCGYSLASRNPHNHTITVHRLVQKVIRWPDEPGAPEYTKLGDALKAGRTNTTSALLHLAHAQTFAERAMRLAPEDPAALKALGFVQSANGEFPAAIATYKKAVALDKNGAPSAIHLFSNSFSSGLRVLRSLGGGMTSSGSVLVMRL